MTDQHVDRFQTRNSDLKAPDCCWHPLCNFHNQLIVLVSLLRQRNEELEGRTSYTDNLNSQFFNKTCPHFAFDLCAVLFEMSRGRSIVNPYTVWLSRILSVTRRGRCRVEDLALVTSTVNNEAAARKSLSKKTGGV